MAPNSLSLSLTVHHTRTHPHSLCSDAGSGHASTSQASNLSSMFTNHGAALLRKQFALLDCNANEWHTQENVAVQQTLLVGVGVDESVAWSGGSFAAYVT